MNEGIKTLFQPGSKKGEFIITLMKLGKRESYTFRVDKVKFYLSIPFCFGLILFHAGKT